MVTGKEIGRMAARAAVRAASNEMIKQLTQEQRDFLYRMYPDYDDEKFDMDKLYRAHDQIAATVIKNQDA